MNNGDNKCVHAVFDEFWNRYKCKLYHHVIFVQDTCRACVRYEEKERTNENNIND